MRCFWYGKADFIAICSVPAPWREILLVFTVFPRPGEQILLLFMVFALILMISGPRVFANIVFGVANSLPHITVLRVFNLHCLRRAMRLRIYCRGMRAAVRLPTDAEISELLVTGIGFPLALLMGWITLYHGRGFTSNSLPHIPVLRVFRLHLLRRAMRLRV